MAVREAWTEEPYRRSHTARAWVYTPYDDAWDAIKDVPALRALFEEELRLPAVPAWADEVITRMLASPLPPCGHYTFPRPILQICEAIGREACPDFVIGCYTAEPTRKAPMATYVYCLDAWLQEAPQEVAAAELAMRADPAGEAADPIAATFEALGARTPERTLLVQRLIHRLRWWLKTLVWRDDRRDRYQPDAYLGDVRGSPEWGDYGQPGLYDPYFVELQVPTVAAMRKQIESEIPGGKALLERIESTWLCAPKVFRYLERLINEIGAVGSAQPVDLGRTLFPTQPTYPNFDSARRWYETFMAALAQWLEGDRAAVPELGTTTPVKHWLAGLLYERLRLYGAWTKFIAGRPEGRSGSQTIERIPPRREA